MTIENRQRKVAQAIANEELEGLTVSFAARKVLDEYIAGRMTAKQAAQQVYSRYGVK